VKVHFVNGDGAQHGHLSRCRIEGAYAEWRGAIPRDGDSVTYTPGEGRNGKPAATNVSIVGAGTPNDTSTSAAVAFGSPAK
jgi:hypothetical protein